MPPPSGTLALVSALALISGFADVITWVRFESFAGLQTGNMIFIGEAIFVQSLGGLPVAIFVQVLGGRATVRSCARPSGQAGGRTGARRARAVARAVARAAAATVVLTGFSMTLAKVKDLPPGS